jgi:hypothetical protein
MLLPTFVLGPIPSLALLCCYFWLLLDAVTKLPYIQIPSHIFDSIPAVDVCTPLLVFDFDTLSFFKIADSDVYNHLTFVGIYFLSGQPYLNIYACKG